MDTPTFYFFKDNHPDQELQNLVRECEECGVRTVVLEKGKQEKNLADNFLKVIKNHI